VTLVGRLALQDVSLEIESGADTARGLAASELGARLALWSGDRSVVSAQAVVVMPGVGENVTDIFFGDGSTDFEARLLYGYGLDWGRGESFVDIQAGYRWRGGDYADEQRLDITLGHKLDSRWMGMAQLFLQASNASQGLNRDYLATRAQLSAVYWIDDRRGVQLGGLATLAGENIIRERGVFAAYWMRF